MVGSQALEHENCLSLPCCVSPNQSTKTQKYKYKINLYSSALYSSVSTALSDEPSTDTSHQRSTRVRLHDVNFHVRPKRGCLNIRPHTLQAQPHIRASHHHQPTAYLPNHQNNTKVPESQPQDLPPICRPPFPNPAHLNPHLRPLPLVTIALQSTVPLFPTIGTQTKNSKYVFLYGLF